MKKLIVLVSFTLLAVEGRVYADAAPPGLGFARQLGPIPTAVLGIALSAAVALTGMTAKRSVGRGLGSVCFVAAAGILAATLLAVLVSFPQRRPTGPLRPLPLRPDEVGLAVSLLAASPDTGFPQCLPWAAIVVNRHGFVEKRNQLFLIDLSLSADKFGNPRMRPE
jgi:hypothetical protein